MCRGEQTHVVGFLWPSVVGRNVGRVAARIGKNSLQEEFWREVRGRGLPATDAPESFVLKLSDPVQVDSSVFLHRLRVLGVPYATFQGPERGRAKATAGDEAGGYAALARVRENWEAQWTPATDIALVERIVEGDSLVGACERVALWHVQRDDSTPEATAAYLMNVIWGGMAGLADSYGVQD